MSTWKKLMRPELLNFAGYGAASPERGVLRLHANESPWDPAGNTEGLNRYPLPDPGALIASMAGFYGVAAGQVLPVRGSDDAIDLLVRAFCRAGKDSILICPPTFGIYAIAARLQNAGTVEVPLIADDYQLDLPGVLRGCNDGVRLVFVCTPNNPTGNALSNEIVFELAKSLAGTAIVVVDEAYIEFAQSNSVASRICELPNLVVLRTLSKAFGLAGIRCGALLAQPELVARLRCLMPPYPLSAQTIETATRQLSAPALARVQAQIEEIRSERTRLAQALRADDRVRRVWRSDANFLLVQPRDGSGWLTNACRAAGILIRRLSPATGAPDSVRITVATRADNDRMLASLAAAGQSAHA